MTMPVVIRDEVWMFDIWMTAKVRAGLLDSLPDRFQILNFHSFFSVPNVPCRQPVRAGELQNNLFTCRFDCHLTYCHSRAMTAWRLYAFLGGGNPPIDLEQLHLNTCCK
jgi:hypothetical protein